jgi:hypothetical protein
MYTFHSTVLYVPLSATKVPLSYDLTFFCQGLLTSTRLAEATDIISRRYRVQ